MRNIFVINPTAGNGKHVEEIRREAERLGAEVYITQYHKDAIRFVDETAGASDEDICFFACGGDGTINEVVCAALKHKNAYVSCVPIGSGNDFVKCFGGMEAFQDIEKLTTYEPRLLDTLDVNGHACDNICHFGFDTHVLKTMISVRNKKIIGGKNAYTTGVITALFNGMKTHGKIVADGETLVDGDFLLCTIANGRYVGGMFCCAPKAELDDGYIDVCILKCVSRLTFLRFVGGYARGEILTNPAYEKFTIYRRVKSVSVELKEGMAVSLDGELSYDNKFTVNINPASLRFIGPETV